MIQSEIIISSFLLLTLSHFLCKRKERNPRDGYFNVCISLYSNCQSVLYVVAEALKRDWRYGASNLRIPIIFTPLHSVAIFLSLTWNVILIVDTRYLWSERWGSCLVFHTKFVSGAITEKPESFTPRELREEWHPTYLKTISFISHTPGSFIRAFDTILPASYRCLKKHGRCVRRSQYNE